MNEFMAMKMHLHLHCSLSPAAPIASSGQGIVLEVDLAIRHAGFSIDEVLI